MERRILGKTGLEVSILGFGGAEIGFEDAPIATVEKLLGSALDAGLNVIDTAECYNASEEKIGQAVGKRRDEFHLFTKCGHASGFDLPDWDPKMLAKSIDRSLQRLGTDRVDLVQLHSCSEELLRQGDVIAVLQKRARRRQDPLHWLQRRPGGCPVRHRVRRVRHPANVPECCRPGADHADLAEGARGEHGGHLQAPHRQCRLETH